jgi:hypothetical protein
MVAAGEPLPIEFQAQSLGIAQERRRNKEIMSIYKLHFSTVAAVLLIILPVVAQGPGGNGRRAPMYNPSTEMTVTGTVEEVQHRTRGSGWGGTHLTLRTEKGTLDVHLGPSSFLAEKQFTFAKGDRIEVTGSKVSYAGGDGLVARVVNRGDKTLTLRGSSGIPLWSRGRRHSL